MSAPVLLESKYLTPMSYGGIPFIALRLNHHIEYLVVVYRFYIIRKGRRRECNDQEKLSDSNS